MLPLHLIGLVLLAAFLHASWNALVKSGDDRLLIFTGVHVAGTIAGGIVVLFVPLPIAASWPFLIASVLAHCLYYWFLLSAYKFGDLSQVYPLSRGSAPLLVAAGSALFAHEFLPPIALTGIVLASLGVMSLTLERGLPWKHDWRPVFFALGTGVWIASYTVLDGMGVRRTGNPLSYIAWLFFLEGFPITLYTWRRRRGIILKFVKANWLPCIAGGLAATSAYGIVIYVMSQGAMGAVAALRETSVIMAALMGTYLLGEKSGGNRILAACIVATGVVLMQLAR
ncbi:MAG: DMT family transporter [Gammaproteobacteria bacterium]|nr:DMT family transporter [Gammaproteobacteria bacterium]